MGFTFTFYFSDNNPQQKALPWKNGFSSKSRKTEIKDEIGNSNVEAAL
jgi:hypothetical protein